VPRQKARRCDQRAFISLVGDVKGVKLFADVGRHGAAGIPHFFMAYCLTAVPACEIKSAPYSKNSIMCESFKFKMEWRTAAAHTVLIMA